MSTHKFAVGKVVDAKRDQSGVIPPGAYEIVRQLPPTTAGTAQYRIKSLQNGHERVVKESDLVADE